MSNIILGMLVVLNPLNRRLIAVCRVLRLILDLDFTSFSQITGSRIDFWRFLLLWTEIQGKRAWNPCF